MFEYVIEAFVGIGLCLILFRIFYPLSLEVWGLFVAMAAASLVNLIFYIYGYDFAYSLVWLKIIVFLFFSFLWYWFKRSRY